VLGVGSAYGDEFRPILDRIRKITILDPSDQLKVTEIDDVPVSFQKPDTQGAINFADESFDLVTCFGVLHHIPNVSFVTYEMGRVLRKGAFALIREPAVSMGDWRCHRPGLTANERGIPELLMRNAIESAGLTVTKRTYCDFVPIAKLGKLLKVGSVYNSTWLTRLDALASQMLAWNVHYQRQNILHKIAPASIFWVCQKQ
jgi:SAM-dependent methyltransferase